MSPPGSLAVTRVVNSRVLLELGGFGVLTDPWFTEHWHLHRGEGLGCTVDGLPDLAAIVGSHFVSNHWDIAAVGGDARRRSTPVVTSHPRMTRQARRAGFVDVRQVAPGDRVGLGRGLHVEAVEAGAPFGMANNSYLIEAGGVRVFFGGEARDLGPLRAFRETSPPVDVALLPVNGLHVLGGPRLVMNAATAVEAATVLGAATLVPIHDAHARDLPYAFVRRSSTGNEAYALAATRAPSLEVVLLHAGVRWESAPRPA